MYVQRRVVYAPSCSLFLRLKSQQMPRLTLLANGAAHRHQTVANQCIPYWVRFAIFV